MQNQNLTIHTTLRFSMQNLRPGQGSDAFKLWRAIRDFLCVPFVRPQCVYLILFAETYRQNLYERCMLCTSWSFGKSVADSHCNSFTLQYNFDSLDVQLKPGAYARKPAEDRSYMFTSAGKLHFRGSAFVSMPQKPQASIIAGSKYGFTSVGHSTWNYHDQMLKDLKGQVGCSGKECEVIRQSDAKCKSAGIWDVFFLKGTAPSASRSSKRSLSGTRTMWLPDKSGVTPVSQSATIHTSAASCKWISPSIITTYIVKQAVMRVLYGWFM